LVPSKINVTALDVTIAVEKTMSATKVTTGASTVKTTKVIGAVLR
jgi:hypothetical protein